VTLVLQRKTFQNVGWGQDAQRRGWLGFVVEVGPLDHNPGDTILNL